MKQLVRSDPKARADLIEADGVRLLFRCRHSPHVNVRKSGIKTIEMLLLQCAQMAPDSKDPTHVLDCYSDEVLCNISAYLLVQPREVGESAGRLLVQVRTCRRCVSFHFVTHRC